MQDSTPPRIQLLDALRGFCILLVIAYHFGYNLVAREYIPREALYNPVLDVLQPFFAGVFIVLAGVSSRFSRSNLKRGLLLLGCALLVTAVSFAALPDPGLSLRAVFGFYQPAEGEQIGVPVMFGILHLLAVCILLYALLEKMRLTAPAVVLSAFFLLRSGVTAWPEVPSADYFPLVPWAFAFFFGVWLGGPIREGTFPPWFYQMKIPVFPAIGRRTLLIYLLHQPALYGILWIAETVIG